MPTYRYAKNGILVSTENGISVLIDALVGYGVYTGNKTDEIMSADSPRPSISYTKLRRENAWGLRADRELTPGSEVEVTLKSGAVKTEIVGEKIWSDDESVWLYTKGERDKRRSLDETRTPPATESASVRAGLPGLGGGEDRDADLPF